MPYWYICWGFTVTFGIRYLMWLWGILAWQHLWFVAFPFFIAELWMLCYFATGPLFRLTAFMRERFSRDSNSGDGKNIPHLQGEHPYVAVVIPVCNEPIEDVHRSVRATLAIDYPHERMCIIIADDGRNEELTKYASEWGVTYLTHPPHTEAKAGNLNRALAYLKDHWPCEWLLVIDAGDTIEPDVMAHVSPHLRDSRIGYVQVERGFTFVESKLPADARYFYEVIMARRERMGSAFACGSGAFWRIEALQDIGGFSTWNLVEDLTTSYMLQQKGWRGKYVFGEPLHSSEYVSDLPRLLKQRWQWAVDTFRLFFWKNPLLQKSMKWVVRWDYAEMGMMYLLAFPTLTLSATPIVMILWPDALFGDGEEHVFLYWCHYLPVFCMKMVTEWIEFRRNHVPFTYWRRQMSLFTGLAPVFCHAALRTLVSGSNRKPCYQATGKNQQRGFFLGHIPFQAVWFFGAIGIVWYGFYSQHITPLALFTSSIWSLRSAWLLLPFIVAAATTSSKMNNMLWRVVTIGTFVSGWAVLATEFSAVYAAVERMILNYLS